MARVVMALVLRAWFAQAGLSAVYVGTVVRMIDGDTAVVRIVTWPDPDQLQTVEARVRLAGINTPELHHPQCSAEAQQAVAAWHAAQALVPNGTQVQVLGVGQHDKYGRLLATLVRADGLDVGAELVRLGHARAYDGKAKAGWCAP